MQVLDASLTRSRISDFPKQYPLQSGSNSCNCFVTNKVLVVTLIAVGRVRKIELHAHSVIMSFLEGTCVRFLASSHTFTFNWSGDLQNLANAVAAMLSSQCSGTANAHKRSGQFWAGAVPSSRPSRDKAEGIKGDSKLRRKILPPKRKGAGPHRPSLAQ